MKQTPQELKILANFKPGKISKNGFLGDDTRHVHDIVKADLITLSKLKLTKEEITDRLQFFIDQGKKALENKVDLGDFTVEIFWSKGMLPCPFGEHGLHYKITAKVFNKKLNTQIEFSQLNVHLIREHGFFEGKGSIFRMEPDEIVKVLDMGR